MRYVVEQAWGLDDDELLADEFSAAAEYYDENCTDELLCADIGLLDLAAEYYDEDAEYYDEEYYYEDVEGEEEEYSEDLRLDELEDEEQIREHTEQIVDRHFGDEFMATLRARVPTFGFSVEETAVVLEVVEEEEPVEIEPTITELSAAGELTVDFDPPMASVPESWDALFDPV